MSRRQRMERVFRAGPAEAGRCAARGPKNVEVGGDQGRSAIAGLRRGRWTPGYSTIEAARAADMYARFNEVLIRRPPKERRFLNDQVRNVTKSRKNTMGK